jgi:hypothetical protein
VLGVKAVKASRFGRLTATSHSTASKIADFLRLAALPQ